MSYLDNNSAIYEWRCSTFAALDSTLLHSWLKLRQEIFVLEQHCLYPDIDDLDFQAVHLLGISPDHQVVAGARIFAPETEKGCTRIGRVCVSAKLRDRGIGRALMAEAINICEQRWPEHNVCLAAQSHLTTYYGTFGFVRAGETYVEDGIPHVDMVRAQ